MKYIRLLSLALGLILFGCNANTKSKASLKPDAETANLHDSQKDKSEIQHLIREVLKWADSKNTIDLLPMISQDSIYVGFDLDKLHQNIEKLKKSGFFADEFIDNYDQIIRTLDGKIKDGKFAKWNTGELPTFSFANDVSPWCLCQDNLSWDNIEVEIVNLNDDKGELKWSWGKLDAKVDPSWKAFSYKFRVVKVNGKWEISYLQGFDYNESIK